MNSSDKAAVIMNEARFYRAIPQGRDRALFAKMQERADADVEYRAQLSTWLRRGSTLELRDLAAPFGSYWSDLNFANAVDGLDSVHASFDRAPA